MQQWWYLPPPYDMTDAIPLQGPPDGARNTGGRAIPVETLQILGEPGGRVPHSVTKDMGWADIEIIDGRTITFKSGGAKTDVGTRIPDTGRGITIEWGGLPPEGEISNETTAMEVPTASLDTASPDMTFPDVVSPDVILENNNNMLEEVAPKTGSKKLTAGGKKRKISEWDYMTTLKGYKF